MCSLTIKTQNASTIPRFPMCLLSVGPAHWPTFYYHKLNLFFPRIFCKRNHRVFTLFMSGFLWSAYCSKDSSILVHVSIVCSFLLLNSIPLLMYIEWNGYVFSIFYIQGERELFYLKKLSMVRIMKVLILIILKLYIICIFIFSQIFHNTTKISQIYLIKSSSYEMNLFNCIRSSYIFNHDNFFPCMELQ